VRQYLNEPTASFWSDTELLNWLNDGTLDIVARTHCLQAVETEQLIENTLSYALADSYILIRSVVYVQAAGVEKGLIRDNLQSIGHVDEVGEPVYWTEDQNNVIVHPKPDASHSGAGHDIDVYTVKQPAVVAADANVLVPACYDRALILYTTAQAQYKDGQFGKADRFLAEYKTELDRYRMDFITTSKEPKEVVS